MTVLFLPLRGSAQEPPEVPPAATSQVAPESVERAIERLDKEIFDLNRALESAQVDLNSAERRFAAAQERLDLVIEPEEVLSEEVAARRLQLSTARRVVALLEDRIQGARAEQQALSRLDALSSRSVQPGTLADWMADYESRRETLARDLSVKRSRADELRQELVFVRQRREALPPGSALESWLGLEAREYQRLLDHYDRDLAGLESEQRLQQELAAALQRVSAKLPLSAKLRALLHRMREVWNYQITASETEPITPGKIISAIAIFLIGYFVASLVSRGLGRRVFPRMRLEGGRPCLPVPDLLPAASRRLSHRAARRGDPAHGLRGARRRAGHRPRLRQPELVNNFISGLILLVERPIKLGDLVEVEGVYGTVERIGLRSTRVRTGDNVDIIVPNSTFLESNVVNWTHIGSEGPGHDRGRRGLRIAHARGGAPDLQAIEEHRRSCASPTPFVLFRDFGDNALIFEVHFWIAIRPG